MQALELGQQLIGESSERGWSWNDRTVRPEGHATPNATPEKVRVRDDEARGITGGGSYGGGGYFNLGLTTGVNMVSCRLCGAAGHESASCPGAYCGKCDARGHTRRVCTVMNRPNERVPATPCPYCRQMGHWRRDCPSLYENERKKIEIASRQSLSGNMIRLRNAGIEKNCKARQSKVYIKMECMGKERAFLLDSG